MEEGEIVKEFIIDPKTAKISPVNKDETLGVFHDNGTSGGHFKMTGEIVSKLSGFGAHINFITHGSDRVISYDVKDLTIAGDTMEFSWILDRRATSEQGAIIFNCCFKKTDDTEWNTTLYKDNILEGAESTGDDEPTESEKETFNELLIRAIKEINDEAERKKQEVTESIKLNTEGLVKSVNGRKPDASGNVVIATSGSGNGTGLPIDAATLLVKILDAGLFRSEQKQNIKDFASMLGVELPDDGIETTPPEEPEEPDNPPGTTDPEEPEETRKDIINKNGDVLSIVQLENDPTKNNNILIIGRGE